MTGIERIAAERHRQIKEEGWTAEHDDQHRNGQLAKAACCYAAPKRIFELTVYQYGNAYFDPWPWEKKLDKRVKVDPSDLSIKERIRNLEKAGALIAAEIDRLERLK